MASSATLPTLDLATQLFVDSLIGDTAFNLLPPAEAGVAFRRLQTLPVGRPGAQIEDLIFPIGPTGSVPVRRAGMASGTADLQRDLGGAIMQSIFGALLTAGYASAAGALVTSSGKDVTLSSSSLPTNFPRANSSQMTST